MNTTTTTDVAPNIPAPTTPVVGTNNTRTKNKWVINLANTPWQQHKKQCYLRPQLFHCPKYPPKKPTPQPLKRLVLNSPTEKQRTSDLTLGRILKNPGKNIKPNLTMEEC